MKRAMAAVAVSRAGRSRMTRRGFVVTTSASLAQLALAACLGDDRPGEPVDTASTPATASFELDARGLYSSIRVTGGQKHLIPLDGIEWGGVARDAIPPIDKPFYAGPERFDQMVYDPERLVIGVEVNGQRRAYPLQVLIWHEIVNETFEGKHLLVTY